jgi:hypothetical protein
MQSLRCSSIFTTFLWGVGVGGLRKAITRSDGELSSSDATISWVDMSGFHCKTEHCLLFESEKLFKSIFEFINQNHRRYQ